MTKELNANEPVPMEPNDPRLGDQQACMPCARVIIERLMDSHPKAAGNTLLAALDMWVQGFPAEKHAALYRAISFSMLAAAATADAEMAGVSIGPAQGHA